MKNRNNPSIHISYRRILFALLILALSGMIAFNVRAAPVPPPDGYPKFLNSSMSVTPELASETGETLTYVIEIRNTGGAAGEDTTLSNPLPAHASYNMDASATSGTLDESQPGLLTWNGEVGFDSSVFITYTVEIDTGFSDSIENSAVIDDPAAQEPVTIQAATVVTDDPILEISKTYTPELPGPNQPLTYTLTVTNQGQPAASMLLTVQDDVPENTTFHAVGPDGMVSPNQRNVTWERTVTLNTGESAEFNYSVLVGDVENGTVITNNSYQAQASGVQTAVGEPLETTIVFPEFSIYKTISPDPPGSNREATYTLSVLNTGSKAMDLVISDDVPAGVQYVSGGTYSSGSVTWQVAELGNLELAEVSYTVKVPDLFDVDLVNENYSVCSGDICAEGTPLTSFIL